MPTTEPNPRQILAVLFGASSFPHAPNLAQGRAFYLSAQDFQEYLQASEGLGLPRQNVRSFFDDTRSPTQQLQDIGHFIESRSTELRNKGTPPQDLIVYYVGHGAFSGPEQSYCLAVRETDERSEGLTSIRVSDLAWIIRNQATHLRKLLIFDCCFSASAYKEFQTGPLQVGRVKLLNELPERGTVLLCSASAQDPSRAPAGLSHTMFSDALLKALSQGHPFLGSRLSVSELGDLIKTNLRDAYPDSWVRPEVHSPDQREGDVAGVPLFPNRASVAQQGQEARSRTERKRVREEAEGRTEAAPAEAERKKQEKADRDRLAREKAEAKRLAVENAEAERKEQEKAERDRLTREKAEAKRLAAESEKEELRQRGGARLLIYFFVFLGASYGFSQYCDYARMDTLTTVGVIVFFIVFVGFIIRFIRLGLR